MISNVIRYFDLQADLYHTKSSNFIWGIQRQREMAAVLSLLGPIEHEEFLELGCGAGFYTRLLLDQGATHVTAVDLSQLMLDQLPNDRVTVIHADAANVKLNKKFGNILSAGLLEFVPDPTAVLANARKFATDDVKVVCLVPLANLAGNVYRWFHQKHGFDISLFSHESFMLTAENAGWTVHASKSVFPYTLVARMGI
jgi:SAM-dependent methyltransferase